MFAVTYVLRSVKDLDDRILPLVGRFFCCSPSIDKDVVKSLRESGVVEFHEFGRETLWPDGFTPLQFDIPLSASVISSMDSSSTSDRESGRRGKRSMIVGSRLSDFVQESVAKARSSFTPCLFLSP